MRGADGAKIVPVPPARALQNALSLAVTAVRPPEFAPRLAYCALLLEADRFVLADTLPFSRQSGHNRTRIATDHGPQWLSVPRRHAGLGQPLTAVGVVEDGWRSRHRHALRAAYGMAPFYEHVAPEWDAVLATPGPLADLAVASVAFTARWLRAPAELVRASRLPGAPDTLEGVVAAAGVEALLTLPESAGRERAALPGLDVRVLRFEEGPRRQTHDGFTPGLGVLDLLMNHGPRSAEVLREGIAGEDGSGSRG